MIVLLFAWLNWLFSTGGRRGGACFFALQVHIFAFKLKKKIFAYVPPVFCGMLHDLPLAFCICCSCTAVSMVRSGTPLSCRIYNQTGIPPDIPDCSGYSHRLFFPSSFRSFFCDCWIFSFLYLRLQNVDERIYGLNESNSHPASESIAREGGRSNKKPLKHRISYSE